MFYDSGGQMIKEDQQLELWQIHNKENNSQSTLQIYYKICQYF